MAAVGYLRAKLQRISYEIASPIRKLSVTNESIPF